MVALRAQRDVGESLARLAGTLESIEFGPDTAAIAAERDRLAATIRSYLIPRMSGQAGPMTVVIAGPTGSGKSTLVNSLSGQDISTTGALRPTTRTPIVLSPAYIAERYQSIGGVPCEVVANPAGSDSLVLVDAPDIDSTSTHHRDMAETLIDNADIVVFVTSALRYADDVPWQVLRRAVSRGTPVVNVLNRVGSASSGAIVDFRSRLAAAGFDDDLITVSEHHLADGAQQVPSLAVRSLRKRLDQVVENQDEFAGAVSDRVLRSTMTSTTDLARSIASISEEIDYLEAKLSAYLVDRVQRLDLSDVTGDLYPDLPEGSSRRTLRRWKKAVARTDPETIQAFRSSLVWRIVSLVHTDVRHWLVEERGMLSNRNVDPGPVISGMTRSARSRIEGWVEFVGRVAADHDELDVWLSLAVLLDAATATDPVPAVGVVFGDDGDDFVTRARRELGTRLELIYIDVGALVIEKIRSQTGAADIEELRATVGAVNATLAPAHA